MNQSTSQMFFTTDDHLALMLMTMWALSTGRTMPYGPPLSLTEQQLIEFWAE
jgi:hypothetical protein